MDLLFSRDPFDKDAQLIFLLGFKQEIQLEISALTLVNTVYTAHKYDIDISEVKSKLQDVCNFVNVLDYPATAVVDALASNWTDYEDTTQYLTAREHGCDCIITRDKKGFNNSDIKTMTPKEFLNSFQ